MTRYNPEQPNAQPAVGSLTEAELLALRDRRESELGRRVMSESADLDSIGSNEGPLERVTNWMEQQFSHMKERRRLAKLEHMRQFKRLRAPSIEFDDAALDYFTIEGVELIEAANCDQVRRTGRKISISRATHTIE